ncbi:nitrogenase iron protein NifH [Petroclostridium sp. X23]|uniref:nitrogenase iron protein NifH n=1 Tax=Petroclostridium sp. X23 TaxID=3045146 RepID=UPI0024AD2880|nr:nitrogenase iron protein NifH [Petroclostridium sp. X23]WHH58724.1 nitrogenase iron protein NifH [Petroclostridium sp. X23]
MYKIAIYGKGGIGKSTTTSNLAAALSKSGYKVMQIGCDPKADSTKNLNYGKVVPTVLDVLRLKPEKTTLADIVFEGEGGVLCVEAGGPTPGIGCAGRGIITAFEKLEELKAYEVYHPDIVLYDVLGDVVCGGFAMPIRGKYARDVFVVTSGEKMSLYAAANIASAITNFKSRGYARLSGVILNSRNVHNEHALVSELAGEIDSEIISVLSRSDYVQRAEEQNTTVVNAFPDSPMAKEYLELAKKVLEVCDQCIH